MKDKNNLNDKEVSKVAGGMDAETFSSIKKDVSSKAEYIKNNKLKLPHEIMIAYGGPIIPSWTAFSMTKLHEDLKKLDEKKKEEVPDPAKPVATELLPKQPENKE